MQIEALTLEQFRNELEQAGGHAPSPTALAALHAHHEELRRWAPKVDLVGPGAVAELYERHYAESLAVLPWLPVEPFRLVDLGSGAGFPGFVLAAARPDAEVWLVEPRERRAAFLASAVRKARLGARVVAARVDSGSASELPDRIQVVTVRALRLDPPLLRPLLPRLASGASLFAWSGEEAPELPAELEPGRTLPLSGSRHRAIREYRWRGAAR